MDTFTWLLIGHLIGDWLLQNDWMAKGKRRGLFTWAGMTHFTIYTVTLLSALQLSGATPTSLAGMFSLGALIFVSHWLTDATHVVEWWMCFYHQTELEPVRLMIDQTFHLLVLVLITVVFLGQ